MRSFSACLAFLAFIAPAALLHAEPQVVEVTMVVTVPQGTTGPVYLTGNLPALGPWKPDALPLTAAADGTYRVTLPAPADFPLEFKLTRGTWATVEKSADGTELPNRTAKLPAEATTLTLTVARFADGAPTSRPSTVTGTLVLLEIVESPQLRNRRTVRVWLPTGYDASADRYPVIYFHDGQNCFDAATSAFGAEWKLDEAATDLIARKEIPGVILVGIDNTGGTRIDEYTATRTALGGGKADTYAEFVVRTVKPMIDARFRTKPDRASTFTAGSSLGGLVSLHLLRKFPDTFAGAGVISPALWWDDRAVLRAFEADKTPFLPDTRIWLDIGTAEGPPGQWGEHIRHTRDLRTLLLARDLPDKNLSYLEADNAPHNETAWSARAPAILKFLLAGK